MEGGFVSEDGDPTSNKWFHLKISPIWGLYKEVIKRIYAGLQ
jgi:hypothetical protein